jgi:adenylosuccinate synthase
MFDTNFFFEPGKVSIVMDGSAGSSGKGKMASFLGENASNWQFCCNAYMSNAAHTVVLDDGRVYTYQALNSVAYMDRFEKMYICGGAVTEVEPLLREIKENNITPKRLGIHPLTAIVTRKDIDYEAGKCDFEGNYKDGIDSANMKLGSTIHGVGAARARRILRRSDVVLARDIPELAPYICWTHKEITKRLRDGQAGLLEIAQGYQLGYLSEFYPKTTSRNCSVAAALDDCQIAPRYAGNVLINFRTYPIRVNSNKYLHPDTKDLITSEGVKALRAAGREPIIVKGDSGGCYPDQEEVTWEQVTEQSGIKEYYPNAEIREITTLTKLERRVYTFSNINLNEAIVANGTGGKTFISINFANYADHGMLGFRCGARDPNDLKSVMTPRMASWLSKNVNIHPDVLRDHDVRLLCLGTGAKSNDIAML